MRPGLVERSALFDIPDYILGPIGLNTRPSDLHDLREQRLAEKQRSHTVEIVTCNLLSCPEGSIKVSMSSVALASQA